MKTTAICNLDPRTFLFGLYPLTHANNYSLRWAVVCTGEPTTHTLLHASTQSWTTLNNAPWNLAGQRELAIIPFALGAIAQLVRAGDS